jgi:hypothetical protein
MKYTAILFACDFMGSSQTLSFSREVDTDDVATVYAYMKMEGQVESDEVDTILLVRSAYDDQGDLTAPEVFKHWSAGGGHFEGLP